MISLLDYFIVLFILRNLGTAFFLLYSTNAFKSFKSANADDWKMYNHKWKAQMLVKNVKNNAILLLYKLTMNV